PAGVAGRRPPSRPFGVQGSAEPTGGRRCGRRPSGRRPPGELSSFPLAIMDAAGVGRPRREVSTMSRNYPDLFEFEEWGEEVEETCRAHLARLTPWNAGARVIRSFCTGPFDE